MISLRSLLTISLVFIFLLPFVYQVFFDIAPDFPPHSLFTVEKGQTVSSVAVELSAQGLITSPATFTRLVVLFGGSVGVQAGDYYFAQPQSVFTIMRRITRGQYGLVYERVTVPEGFNKFEIAALFEKNFAKFDEEYFLTQAKEGYLFPDTYFVLPNVDTDAVLAMFEKNFEAQTSHLKEGIQNSQKSLEDIVTMASLLEEEARTTETRSIISGILWNRLEIGMPLQVDVTFQYINGKNSYELTTEDLKINDPYNSYTNKGLPPTPISNPGLDSLTAALYPSSTPYLYFLSSRAGTMYYAVDFEGHKRNRALYLD